MTVELKTGPTRNTHTLDTSVCPGVRVFSEYEPNYETTTMEFEELKTCSPEDKSKT